MAEEERAAREARMAARERERAPRRDRDRLRSRSRSPGRGGRYAVSPPKQPTYEGERAQAAVSKRYKDMYLPSDFVKVGLILCCFDFPCCTALLPCCTALLHRCCTMRHRRWWGERSRLPAWRGRL